MKRQRIQKAYDRIRPDEEARARMLENILRSSEIPPAGKDERLMRRKVKPLVIAALIALMLLMMGCAVIAFGLEELKIGEAFAYGQILDSEGNILAEKQMSEGSDVISLQGMMNSNGYQAAQEWIDFKDAYDPDQEIMFRFEESGSDYRNWEEEYFGYGCYSDEMADKINEICDKYDLVMHTGETHYFQSQELFDAAGIETIHRDGEAAHNFVWGYCFDDGTFQMEENVGLTLESDMVLQVPYQLRRVKKNALDVAVLNIGQLQEYEQWQYTAWGGVRVLLAISGGRGLILVDCDESFVTVNTIDCFVSGGYTKEIMETFAQTFDFTKIP